MASPILTKPPFAAVWAMFSALPAETRRAVFADFYGRMPKAQAIDLNIDIRSAILASAPRMEAGEGGQIGETITHVPARPSPGPAPQRDAD